MKENKEKEIFLNKISKVVDFMPSTSIPSLDMGLRNVNNIFKRVDPLESFGTMTNIEDIFESYEAITDMQNIPKWWRSLYNWGASISFSFTWASAWLRLLDEKRQVFTKENNSSDFNEFVKSGYFDGEAWYYAKYYLDNAIVRLYSYREKLVWLLNSHSKLCLLPNKQDKKIRISFRDYLRETTNLSRDFYPIVDILSKQFTSKDVDLITDYYRHNFIHNDTPIIDWPKEQQATVSKKYDKNNKLVSLEAPLFGLQPPDFEIDTLMKDALYVWGQFVEGTSKTFELLNKFYYQDIQVAKNEN